MTKVGEGKNPGKRLTRDEYKKELDVSCAKFLNALKQYENANDMEQRDRFKVVMDEQLLKIRSAEPEIRRHDVDLLEVKIENDYKTYLGGRAPDGYSALYHDVQTLKDYMGMLP